MAVKFGRLGRGERAVSSRRGQFYSIIAVMIAIPVLFFITVTLVSVQETRFSAAEKIVADQLHLVEKSVEDDFHKGVEISIKRAILTLTDDVITNGTFITPVGMPFLELLQNGTLNNETTYLMINNTLPDWKDNILNATTGFDVGFNFTYPTAEMSGASFYGTYGITIRVADRFGISRIERTNVRKNYSFSVEGFEDPFFALGSSGLVRRQYAMYPFSSYAIQHTGSIASRNFTGNVSFDAGSPDTSKVLVTSSIGEKSGWGCVVGKVGNPAGGQSCWVKLLTEDPVGDINQTINSLGGYSTVYVDNATGSVWSLPVNMGIEQGLYFTEFGPNVFERIEGSYNSSVPQFLTFVNTDELGNAGIQVDQSQSQVAWAYFGGYAVAGYPVRGMPSWFRIDNSTAEVFNLTELLQQP